MKPTISRGLAVVASIFAALSLALVPALFSIGEPIRALASLAAGGALVLYVVVSRHPEAGEEVKGAVLHPYDAGGGRIGYTRIEQGLKTFALSEVHIGLGAENRLAWLEIREADDELLFLTPDTAAQLGIALLAFSADALDREALAAYVAPAGSTDAGASS